MDRQSQLISVPNVAGNILEVATQMLLSEGIEVSSIRQTTSTRRLLGISRYILSQSPFAGTLYPGGSLIDLVVTIRISQTVPPFGPRLITL